MDLLTTAKRLADKVEAKASESKVPVTVCVIDSHGNVVLKHRMTQAPTFSLELAERGLHIRARRQAHSRPLATRTARATALPSHHGLARQILCNRRRGTAHRRRSGGRGCGSERGYD